MKSIKITALTELGQKGLQIMKEQCSSWIVKRSLKMLKTNISFNCDSVTIRNEAMQFCNDLNHEKSNEGIKQIIEAFTEISAKENVDYKIEEVK